MKKILVLTIGKNKNQYISEGIKDFSGKIKYFCQFEIRYLKEIKKQSISAKEIIEKETNLLISEARESKGGIVLLDVMGKSMESEQWSQWQETELMSSDELVFIIGGPYGFNSDKFNNMPVRKISLSKLTFNHQIVRLMLLEQIYRGFAIARGLPYHK